jgi:tripartite-type tricarboxylate transporter receptor subunit TctC
MRRDKLLRLAALMTLALGAGIPAAAQEPWPAGKPIRLIVPFAPGGPLDHSARVIAPKLSEALGQTVVVENITGGGGSVGIARLAQSAPDGHTFALGHVGSLSIAPHLYEKVGYDPLRSFAPVSMLADYANVLVVNANEPYRTVGELLKAVRENPGKITYGSSGNGSSNHLSGALLASMTGAQMTHVPFRGTAPSMNELLAGRLTMMFDVLLNSMPHIQSGKLRALAVTNQGGLPQLPGVPPLSQFVPGYEVLGWVGLVAPAGTPPRVVERTRAEIEKIMKMPDVIAGYARVGFDARTSTPAELQAVMKKDLELWGPVVKATGAKAE